MRRGCRGAPKTYARSLSPTPPQGQYCFSLLSWTGVNKQKPHCGRKVIPPPCCILPSLSPRPPALLLGSSLPEERSRHFIFGCRNKHLLCSHSPTRSLAQFVLTLKIEEVSLPHPGPPPLVGPIRGPRGGTPRVNNSSPKQTNVGCPQM